ncbi:MAG: hypothetical protein RI897_3584 [Verrucomicrobiota bacterium]
MALQTSVTWRKESTIRLKLPNMELISSRAEEVSELGSESCPEAMASAVAMAAVMRLPAPAIIHQP